VAVLALRRRWRPLVAAAALAAAAAETGRRRAGGRAWFPASSSLLAPLWLLERSASSWLALHARLFRGGVAYAGGRLRRAATPERVLRARLAARRVGPDPRPAQPGGSVSGRRPANPVSGQCHHSTDGSPSTQHSR
jgi:hypothetical protein